MVRPALLWNDTRSAGAAADLIADLGGPRAWADAVGLVPVASFTVTKLRWLADHEPEAAARVAAVCLPARLADLAAGRGGEPGVAGHRPGRRQRHRLLVAGRRVVPSRAAGARPRPRRPGPGRARPAASPGDTAGGAVLAAGTGDNMAAALGLGARPGDVVVSVGTSGTVFAVGAALRRPLGHRGRVRRRHRAVPAAGLHPERRPGPGRGRGHARCRPRAAVGAGPGAPAGAGGLTLVPYLEGERTPNRPHATGALHGLRLAAPPRSAWPGRPWRAAVRPRRRAGRGRRGGRGAPGAAGRRRGPLGGAAPGRPGRARPPGGRPGAVGVRGRRRRPPGRLGPGRRARAARWEPAGTGPTRPTRSRRSASATGSAAT